MKKIAFFASSTLLVACLAVAQEDMGSESDTSANEGTEDFYDPDSSLDDGNLFEETVTEQPVESDSEAPVDDPASDPVEEPVQDFEDVPTDDSFSQPETWDEAPSDETSTDGVEDAASDAATEAMGDSAEESFDEPAAETVPAESMPVVKTRGMVASGAPSTQDIQAALNQFGASLTADGKTGPKTRNAIRNFQKQNNLNVTGTVDDATRAALGL